MLFREKELLQIKNMKVEMENRGQEDKVKGISQEGEQRDRK